MWVSAQVPRVGSHPRGPKGLQQRPSFYTHRWSALQEAHQYQQMKNHPALGSLELPQKAFPLKKGGASLIGRYW